MHGHSSKIQIFKEALMSSGNTVTGATQQNDFLVGLAGPDVIDGGEGDDSIQGEAGADTLIGGYGADVWRRLARGRAAGGQALWQ
jgi:Ca2+-binding RTX toxin-like protein